MRCARNSPRHRKTEEIVMKAKMLSIVAATGLMLGSTAFVHAQQMTDDRIIDPRERGEQLGQDRDRDDRFRGRSGSQEQLGRDGDDRLGGRGDRDDRLNGMGDRDGLMGRTRKAG
jgi:hypothetical protein